MTLHVSIGSCSSVSSAVMIFVTDAMGRGAPGSFV